MYRRMIFASAKPIRDRWRPKSSVSGVLQRTKFRNYVQNSILTTAEAICILVRYIRNVIDRIISNVFFKNCERAERISQDNGNNITVNNERRLIRNNRNQ